MTDAPPILGVVGPTASGKTELALALGKLPEVASLLESAREVFERLGAAPARERAVVRQGDKGVKQLGDIETFDRDAVTVLEVLGERVELRGDAGVAAEVEAVVEAPVAHDRPRDHGAERGQPGHDRVLHAVRRRRIAR